jgi:death-on-curing protein
MAKRREPRWLDRIVIDAVHADQVRQHGGLAGLRDEHALESALARPRHRRLYGEPTDLATLAAAYAFGLSRSHPYRDGNKRIAFLALATFLGINGHELETTDADVVATMMALADGTLKESPLAEWVRQRMRSAN